ncbi:D-mycarose 3-C-methyltransferase [Planctomycetales bacterium]|nr:D-mycarose 3-C-methyltransferase [Planctomycetales bacterium]
MDITPPPPCRVCDKQTVEFESLRYLINETSVLATESTLPHYFDATLFECRSCGHYQIDNVIRNDYYLSYCDTVLKEKPVLFGFYYEERKNNLMHLRDMAVSHQKFLEIGCGFGGVLDLAEPHFRQLIGVEPSKHLSSMVTPRKNLEIINDYFRQELAIGDGFDAFCSTQVFEHVSDPLPILRKVFAATNPGGVGWIEVPNGLAIVNERHYHSIFSDHLNYYTPNSLSTLAHLAGFQTVSISEGLDGYWLNLFVRKPKNNRSFMNERERQLNLLLDYSQNYSHIVGWGCGAKGISILGILGGKLQFANLVDSNIGSNGKFVPGCSTRVEIPSTEIFQRADLVIIFADPFKAEITKALRDDFNYQGQILCLSELLAEQITTNNHKEMR